MMYLKGISVNKDNIVSERDTGEHVMELKKWLEKWDMTSLKINLKFLEMNWEPNTADQDAAWQLYIEMLTRIATQRLQPDHGDERTALESIHCLFGITRDILKIHGRDCVTFSKIAVVVLNQVIRPFTAKWHKEALLNAFENEKKCQEFREELTLLQIQLRNYTAALADIAGVEDLTTLEETS